VHTLNFVCAVCLSVYNREDDSGVLRAVVPRGVVVWAINMAVLLSQQHLEVQARCVVCRLLFSFCFDTATSLYHSRVLWFGCCDTSCCGDNACNFHLPLSMVQVRSGSTGLGGQQDFCSCSTLLKDRLKLPRVAQPQQNGETSSRNKLVATHAIHNTKIMNTVSGDQITKERSFISRHHAH
jgi:hypothetical protein